MANALGLRRVLLEAGVSEAYIDSLALPTPPSAEPEAATITESEAPPPVESMMTAAVVDLPSAEAPPVDPILTELEPVNSVIDIPMELPLSLPLTVDSIPLIPDVEMVEITPSAAPQASLSEPGPDLTPDYPSTGKPKRGKRTPPPQPTLF